MGNQMNRYSWQYRGGEITGNIVAESEDDAYNKLYAQRPDLHTDMFEVELAESDIKPEREHIGCEICGNTINPDEHCYQIRYGHIEEDGITFLPEEDIAYHCEGCGVERGNFSS